MSILLGILVGLALPVQTSVNNKLRDKVGTPYNSSWCPLSFPPSFWPACCW